MEGMGKLNCLWRWSHLKSTVLKVEPKELLEMTKKFSEISEQKIKQQKENCIYTL